jgi:pimeloyl-ACP methyl ester carboxylesterase
VSGGAPISSSAVSESAGVVEDPPAAVLESGSGAAVLLLHGWGASKELMQPIAQRLPSFRVIAPDLPGFGATGPPPAPWGVDEYAQWTIALLDRLGVQRVHVVGHSNGGRVAIALATAHPERVDRLVLADSAGIRPRHGLRHHWRVRSFKLLRAAARWRWLPARVREAAQRRASLRGSADYREASGTVRDSMVRLVNADLRPRLAQLRAPTLLIWGERDRYLGIGMTERLTRWVPNVQAVRLAHASHWVQNDAPERVNELLLKFLRPT